MTLIDGTEVLTGSSENTLFDVTGQKIYACYINMSPMAAAEEFTIRAYLSDASAGAEVLFLEQTLVGVQAVPMFFIPWLPNYTFKVTLQKISGANNNFNWIRVEEG